MRFINDNLCLSIVFNQFILLYFFFEKRGHVSILHGCLVTLATCALGLVGSYHVLLPNGGLCTSRLFVIKIKSC